MGQCSGTRQIIFGKKTSHHHVRRHRCPAAAPAAPPLRRLQAIEGRPEPYRCRCCREDAVPRRRRPRRGGDTTSGRGQGAALQGGGDGGGAHGHPRAGAAAAIHIADLGRGGAAPSPVRERRGWAATGRGWRVGAGARGCASSGAVCPLPAGAGRRSRPHLVASAVRRSKTHHRQRRPFIAGGGGVQGGWRRRSAGTQRGR